MLKFLASVFLIILIFIELNAIQLSCVGKSYVLIKIKINIFNKVWLVKTVGVI